MPGDGGTRRIPNKDRRCRATVKTTLSKNGSLRSASRSSSCASEPRFVVNPGYALSDNFDKPPSASQKLADILIEKFCTTRYSKTRARNAYKVAALLYKILYKTLFAFFSLCLFLCEYLYNWYKNRANQAKIQKELSECNGNQAFLKEDLSECSIPSISSHQIFRKRCQSRSISPFRKRRISRPVSPCRKRRISRPVSKSRAPSKKVNQRSQSRSKSTPKAPSKTLLKAKGHQGCKYQYLDTLGGFGYNENSKCTQSYSNFRKAENESCGRGDESSLSILTQVTLPFIIAGYGTVGAGMVLDIVQHWDVFVKVGEIFILVPALLGLKGNLEMTLASRLGTQANLGNMDTRKELMSMIGGNLALVQAQAIVVGFLASVTAMVMGWIPEGEFDIHHGLLLCASSLFTAALASLLLGLVMIIVILVSRKVRINPDNVATPIAASLGDLVTLSILAWVANMLFEAIGKQHWIAPSIIGVFLLMLPVWVWVCLRNKYTKDVIQNGWTPVLAAMFISSIGGLILDFTVSNYNGIAVFQPVINGVGGNLVAVHASRLSTILHKKGKPGSHGPCRRFGGCLNPLVAFFGKGVHSRAARVLVLLTVPGHLLFVYTIYYMKAGHTSLSPMFQGFYLVAAITQVILLLYIATWMVPLIWVKGSDPDNAAIPYLTAIGDLLGTAFLAVAFHLMYLMGDRDADVGD